MQSHQRSASHEMRGHLPESTIVEIVVPRLTVANQLDSLIFIKFVWFMFLVLFGVCAIMPQFDLLCWAGLFFFINHAILYNSLKLY